MHCSLGGGCFHQRTRYQRSPSPTSACSKGDAFKQITDTRAVVFCVEREPDLCSEVIAAVTSRNPTVVSGPKGNLITNKRLLRSLFLGLEERSTSMSAPCRSFCLCDIFQSCRSVVHWCGNYLGTAIIGVLAHIGLSAHIGVSQRNARKRSLVCLLCGDHVAAIYRAHEVLPHLDRTYRIFAQGCAL